MQVGRAAEPGDPDLIAAAICAIADMQRLVEIADDVNDKRQRELLILTAGCIITQNRGLAGQGLGAVAFRRRSDLPVSLPDRHGHVVPRVGLVLPEWIGVRLLVIGQGRDLSQVLRLKDLRDLGARPAADPFFRQLTDDPVAELAPGVGDRRNDGGERRCGEEQVLHGSPISRTPGV